MIAQQFCFGRVYTYFDLQVQESRALWERSSARLCVSESSYLRKQESDSNQESQSKEWESVWRAEIQPHPQLSVSEIRTERKDK